MDSIDCGLDLEISADEEPVWMVFISTGGAVTHEPLCLSGVVGMDERPLPSTTAQDGSRTNAFGGLLIGQHLELWRGNLVWKTAKTCPKSLM